MTQRPHVNHADFMYNGKTYTLGHLDGFDIKYEWFNKALGMPVYFDVRVSFTDHCYTEGIAKYQIHNPMAVVSQNNTQTRIFDPVRYQLSLSLPSIIRQMIGRVCYFGSQNNFFIIDTNNNSYHVYFEVKKETGRGGLRLIIQSAYIRNATDRLEKVSFGLILKKTRDNQPIKPHR